MTTIEQVIEKIRERIDFFNNRGFPLSKGKTELLSILSDLESVQQTQNELIEVLIMLKISCDKEWSSCFRNITRDILEKVTGKKWEEIIKDGK